MNKNMTVTEVICALMIPLFFYSCFLLPLALIRALTLFCWYFVGCKLEAILQTSDLHHIHNFFLWTNGFWFSLVNSRMENVRVKQIIRYFSFGYWLVVSSQSCLCFQICIESQKVDLKRTVYSKLEHYCDKSENQ